MNGIGNRTSVLSAYQENAVVAQLVEHQPSKLRVASSNLVRRSQWKSPGSQAEGREFPVRQTGYSLESLFIRHINSCAYVAQSVEHVLGKDGVTGSSPVVGSVN